LHNLRKIHKLRVAGIKIRIPEQPSSMC
jgi:hypothetical protein